jgi:McrBC 5-methylcytosine restriction system component
MDRKPVSPARRASARRVKPANAGAFNWRERSNRNVHEATDSSERDLDAEFLLQGQSLRDSAAQTARLAGQFIRQNRDRLLPLDVSIEPRFDGSRVCLKIRTGTRVGAISLTSPTTGKSDYGLVVKPRHGWSGIGAILSATGWRVLPSVLAQPMLPRSDRKIPPWVLSTIILFRLRALLERLERRFDLATQERSAPRGSVDWTSYARRQISRARFLSVPCTFPDLRDDRNLKSAIRFTLEAQLGSLESQRTGGTFVLALIELCQRLLDRVRDVAPREPMPSAIQSWLSSRLNTNVLRHGVEAIEWTAQERGLAGLSDLRGLPWAMPMDAFFESWAETIMARVAARCGGILKAGRKRETVVPLSWSPPYLGSQKSLVPDLVLERDDLTVIVDAKYKDHWEEMQTHRWSNLEEAIRERHREDLLQVLAYSSIARTRDVMVCLAYPCRADTWSSLRERKLLFHRASVPSAGRRVDVLLTAFPLSTRNLDDAAVAMASEVSRMSSPA